ncbi:phosphate ABC transporter permease PstA [Desulfurispira natronophila]|uniref:Phosphate transport system permease protein PstA n=1 Tax=Desulfurispira natronophila TaxID=682562 RepID=A0A7W7Y2Y6_9BACT|nr:phosphate ABC transporter permease PstA [Desulfurispira natronophila]MBB5021064.1 phosphate transport system permease protein [Desulfurispira natronophila]
MKKWFNSGTPWVWLNAGAVTLCIIMVVGLLSLIAVRGFSHFWPATVYEFTYHQPDGEVITVIGELTRSEVQTAVRMREAGHDIPADMELVERHLFKQGNRDLTRRDFMWYHDHLMEDKHAPADILVLERWEWGDFYGRLLQVKENGEVIADQGETMWDEFRQRLSRSQELSARINQLERYDIGSVNQRMEQVRLDERRMELRQEAMSPDEAEQEQMRVAALRQSLDDEYAELYDYLLQLRQQNLRDSIVARTMEGTEVTIPMANIVRAYQPNAMTTWEKMKHYAEEFKDFITGYPREANTEGGILPAIFGTVLMVIIMSIVVTPFGVLAAIYLREYAKQGPIVRTIRIAVNNLAGVPSIVFGVFGLGFFVYFLGGNIDRIFYPEALPSPTFGTPALIWASLTLALLTLPVVIVSTEEGLTRIPSSIRNGSLALGATKSETLWKVIVPLSAPAMMTGLILAVARAAGEVAPLMLVGVVKLAPNLPIDGNPPFIHLERQFMHLGFHIYDVGFQSPNVEAARPLVYATALTLVIIIVALNLTAISIRNYLREKYRSESD